ncbi:hypothetical protein JXA27_07035 [Aerococcaceae bacterium zg-B36]|uniref:hypothetical protein n=1 Tax=Aerococcaceae bacterium zg-252 TaxID=2796928 RepID=UPI001BD892C7|nr:hypothetical protein [Aerococcaceae bacterium zg-B36]
MLRDGTPIDILRMLNIPFIESIWVDMVRNDEIEYAHLSSYLKIIAPKKQYESFHDSEVFIQNKKVFTVNEKIVERWGKGFSADEYETLEIDLDNLKRIKVPDTKHEEQMYIENVLLKKRYRTALADGTPNEIKGLKEAYTKDLKDLGLDISSTDLKGAEALGERIRYWENNDPLPEIDSQFEDVDNIEKYINKFFLIPMKRMFDKATAKDIEHLYTNEEDIIPQGSKE